MTARPPPMLRSRAGSGACRSGSCGSGAGPLRSWRDRRRAAAIDPGPGPAACVGGRWPPRPGVSAPVFRASPVRARPFRPVLAVPANGFRCCALVPVLTGPVLTGPVFTGPGSLGPVTSGLLSPPLGSSALGSPVVGSPVVDLLGGSLAPALRRVSERRCSLRAPADSEHGPALASRAGLLGRPQPSELRETPEHPPVAGAASGILAGLKGPGPGAAHGPSDLRSERGTH